MAEEERDYAGEEPAYVEQIRRKSVDFAGWYNDVVRKAELADYTPVRGCMVIRPYGYALWERIRDALDAMIKETGHQNMYFPLFIPESYLMKEAEHIEGFAPEVAWVTRGGSDELEEPLAVRPTSETIIGPLYQKWIRSYRDLPVLVNQWANVVRWEMRTRLFLRTTEFLWQEGHTFHETHEEAAEETRKMHECYMRLAEDWLAVPPLSGRKTELEKFAGADYTISCEWIMSDGRALQTGTSHHLGQNFTRAYDITFAGRDNTRQHPFGTSWGLSSRAVGGIIMAHGDDAGLILPPRVAPIQAVVVPIYRGEGERATVLAAIDRLRDDVGGRVRLHVDDRDEKPGYKFNDWELRGVPLRLEVGPRDVAAGTVLVVDRIQRSKNPISTAALSSHLHELLDDFQKRLLQRALSIRQSFIVEVASREELLSAFAGGKNGVAHGPWCGDTECEIEIKAASKGATIRVIDEAAAGGGSCVGCGKDPRHQVYWARAY